MSRYTTIYDNWDKEVVVYKGTNLNTFWKDSDKILSNPKEVKSYLKSNLQLSDFLSCWEDEIKSGQVIVCSFDTREELVEYLESIVFIEELKK